MEDKQKVILAYNTFRIDLRENTLTPKIKSEFINRNAGNKRIGELDIFIKRVYNDEPIEVLPEEIRLMLREMRI